MFPRPRVQLAAALFLVTAFACGPNDFGPAHEDPYVDHDLGEITSGLTVGQAGGCDTSIVVGLTRQLVEELNCIAPNSMVNISGGGISIGASSPYLAPSAASALRSAIGTSSISLSSAYRSVAAQYLLYKWWKAGQCGIQLAAEPGSSNHQSGRAIDVPSYNSWITKLQAKGWKWLGNSDRVHFDYFGAKDLGSSSVRAWQRLYNKNHSTGKLVEDGIWGPASAGAMAGAPTTGYPVHGCVMTGKLTGAIYQAGNTASRVSGATVTVAGQSVTTGADGLYTFTLAPGTYTASVSKSGYSSASVSRAVTAGGTIWGSMEINPVAAQGTLKGKAYVYNPANPADLSQAISGAVATVSGQSQTTGADGLFTFKLAPGVHTVTVSKAGYQSASVSRQVTANADVWGSVGLSLVGTADQQPPTLAITSPRDGDVLDLAMLDFAATASDNAGPLAKVSLSVNGGAAVELPVMAGKVTSDLKLAPGLNTLQLSAVDAAGNRGTATVKATFASGLSGKIETSAELPLPIADAKVELREVATGAVVVAANSDALGNYKLDTTKVPGDYTLHISAPGFVTYEDSVTLTDEERASVDVQLTASAPALQLLDPEDGAQLEAAEVEVNGLVLDFVPTEIRVNDVAAQLLEDGRFTARIPLVEGENLISAVAVNAAGEELRASITVKRLGSGAQLPEETGGETSQKQGGCASVPGLPLLGLIALVRLRRRRRHAGADHSE